MIEVTSHAFTAGAKIPTRHTGEGDDVSPPLRWNGPTGQVASYALICDDPDAPREEPFVHWVVYDMPGDTQGLEEGAVGGGVEGRNDFGRSGYGGPMPPEGHGTHHYHFKLYALDRRLELATGARKHEVLEAMQGHVLDEGELVGTYER